MEVSYENCRLHELASGVVLHSEDADTYYLDMADQYVAYADPTDSPDAQNFQIYTGCVYPNQVKELKTLMFDNPTNGNAGHILGVVDYKEGDTFTYYAGSAWSNYNVPTMDAWKNYLSQFSRNLATPLEVVIR